MTVDFIRFLIFAGVLAGLVVVALAVPAFRPYLRKNPAVAFLLGISSGFPFTLIAATMTFWLAKVGFTPTAIGFAVMVGIPYTIKFLWAPLVDKIPLPVLTKALGQRRSWLFLVQFFLVLSIWQMGASDPQPGDYRWFLFWAVVTAFFSATQDIVIDAYRIEILEEDEFAHGTATNQFGYRTGNLIAGAGTIYFASQEGLGLGWAMAYGLTTLCVLPAVIGAFWAGEGKFIDRFSNAAGMKPVPAATIAAARIASDNHRVRFEPSPILRSASGSAPISASRAGRVSSGPCRTITSPACSTVLPGLLAIVSPSREMARRLMPSRSRICKRPAVRPISPESACTTASITPIPSGLWPLPSSSSPASASRSAVSRGCISSSARRIRNRGPAKAGLLSAWSRMTRSWGAVVSTRPAARR